MRSRDVRRLIAPDCPRSEGELEKEQNDPQSRQSSKNGNRIRVFPNPNTKRNYSDADQQCEKTMRHLQPDLKCVDIRKRAGVAPRIDLCQRGLARVRDPCAIRGWKVEDRQILVLMSHRGSECKLRVNRDCRHN